MSTDYAGSSTSYPTNVRLVSDGEDRDATTLARPLEDLADRTAYLKRYGADKIPAFDPFWRMAPSEWHPGDPTKWGLSAEGMWVALDDSGSLIHCSFRIPAGATISGISLSVCGAAGHSWPIEHGPVLSLRRLGAFPSVAATELWNSGEDPFKAGVNYQSDHAMPSMTGGPYEYSIGPDAQYFDLMLTNEWGTNALSGLKVARPIIHLVPSTTLDGW